MSELQLVDGAVVRLRNGETRLLRKRPEGSTAYVMFPWSLHELGGQFTGITLNESGRFWGSGTDPEDVVEILGTPADDRRFQSREPEPTGFEPTSTQYPQMRTTADPATLAGFRDPEKYASGGGGKRFSEGKLRFDLNPYEWLVELARVNTEGSKKYGDSNWLKGMNYHECLRGAYSHLTKWQSGQDLDHETGCHHLAHVAWNVLALMSYEMRGLGVDNLLGEQGTGLELDAHAKWTKGTDLAKRIGTITGAGNG